MAWAIASDGVRLAYQTFGRRDGAPLLLVQGLGADCRGWLRQRMALGAHFRCIAFDNRGAGRSDAPDGPYDLEVMAADAVAVLDAAGVDSAHVVGASMGGVISQLLVLRHRDRVRSLTLACTACQHHPWRRELLEEWATIAGNQGMAALVPRAVPWMVGPRSLRRYGAAVGVLGSLVLDTPAAPFVAQVRAILAMSDELRHELGAVEVPTLVLVGSQDILTPLGDSEELAARIPGARLVVVRGAAHGFMFERARDFNRHTLRFLRHLPAPDPDSLTAAEQ